MKKLLVVSALVALAIAAPALPGDASDSTDRTHDWHLQAQSSLPDTLQRKKKSPSEISTSSISNNGVSNSELQNVHVDAGVSTPIGRSFTLKKPLIVKKKYGYQVYRDSEEEKAHADSNESCGRQVKVKFCNEDKLRTSVTGHEGSDIHTKEDDMKQSIKMAKEAVENLQRDLKKMEMKTEMKTAHESQSDTELHEDIEVARQALKHIHDNFGTLESMSLHATTTRDSEDMHDVHVTIAKTEEDRMVQWKEAMHNIQRNVEIAKSIEDSFVAASVQDKFMKDKDLDQSDKATTIADKIEENVNLLSELETLKEKQATEEIFLNKDTIEHMSKHNVEDDMKTAPSEMIEVHLDHIKNQEPLRSENQKIHEQEKSAEVKLEGYDLITENKDLLNKEDIDHHLPEKRSAVNMDMLTDQSEHHIMQVPLMRAVDETETKLNEEKIPTFKTSENTPLTPIDMNTLNKPLTLDAFSEHQKTAEEIILGDKIEHRLKQEKSVGDCIPCVMDFFARSADHLDQDKRQKEELHKEHLLELAKVAENLKPEHGEHLTANWGMKPMEAVEIKHLDSILNLQDQLVHTHIHNLGENNQNIMLAKSVDHTSFLDHQKQEIEHYPKQGKSAGDCISCLASFFARSADHLDEDKRQKEELHKEHLLELAKAAENLKSEHGEHLTADWDMKPMEAVEIKHLDSIPKSSDQLVDTHIHNLGEHNQNIMLAKSVDHTSILDHQKQQIMQQEEMSSVETSPEMKAAEEHLHHLQQLHNAHWVHEHRQLNHISSIKTAEDFGNELRMGHRQAHGHGIMSKHTIHHLRNSHLGEHGQIPTKMDNSHDFNIASHVSSHAHHPTRYHHNSMYSQTHDMSEMGMQSNFHPSMRDEMEGLGSDHMVRWKPVQESARVAYGSGLSSSTGSTGAVGVFPKANIGGCGIPLLLSCSPSVVSGSLAKPHPAGPSSYSAPSYRTEEDFAFHNKRDVKKTSDVRTSNVLRSPTILKQKNSITLEKKM